MMRGYATAADATRRSAIGAMGGGDVKLLGACALLVPPVAVSPWRSMLARSANTAKRPRWARTKSCPMSRAAAPVAARASAAVEAFINRIRKPDLQPTRVIPRRHVP